MIWHDVWINIKDQRALVLPGYWSTVTYWLIFLTHDLVIENRLGILKTWDTRDYNREKSSFTCICRRFSRNKLYIFAISFRWTWSLSLIYEPYNTSIYFINWKKNTNTCDSGEVYGCKRIPVLSQTLYVITKAESVEIGVLFNFIWHMYCCTLLNFILYSSFWIQFYCSTCLDLIVFNWD